MGPPALGITFKYNQLDFKNQDTPLFTQTDAYELSFEGEATTVRLGPNEFTDNNGILGFFEGQYEAQEYLAPTQVII